MNVFTLVQSNLVRAFTVSRKGEDGVLRSVNLLPGENRVAATDWETVAEHPQVKEMTSRRVFGPETAPVDLVVREAVKRDELDVYTKLTVKQAIERVPGVMDLSLLQRWREAEVRRPTVREAVEGQIEALTVPSEKPKDGEAA